MLVLEVKEFRRIFSKIKREEKRMLEIKRVRDEKLRRRNFIRVSYIYRDFKLKLNTKIKSVFQKQVSYLTLIHTLSLLMNDDLQLQIKVVDI